MVRADRTDIGIGTNLIIAGVNPVLSSFVSVSVQNSQRFFSLNCIVSLTQRDFQYTRFKMIAYTGLFEMIVGVLTTCLTQYT
jgi:hypothetical protein